MLHAVLRCCRRTVWENDPLLQAQEAIDHPYFREKPFPQESSMMPTFPSLHPDMKDSAKPVHESQHRHENLRFGNAFGGSTSASFKKRRV